MAHSSKRKGDDAELEVQALLRDELGYPARRARRAAQRRQQRALNRARIDPTADWHGTTNGYTNHCCRCDPCRTAYRAYNNEWRKRPEVAERIRVRARELSKRPHEVLRRKAAQYGLDKELLGEYLADGVCFACGGKFPMLSIDHDHRCCPGSRRACGDCVRGLLCDGCNKALGTVGDSIERLQGLIAYLERWEAKRVRA